MDLKELIEATQGRMLNFRSTKIRGISTDSRTIKKGEAFIAIKGINFDGHDFVNKAITKGASCVIVSNRLYRQGKNTMGGKKIPVLLVRDTIKALGDIAHYHRKKFKMPIIAVTGSTGKTTVKEIISHILSSRYRVLKNEGTKNNMIGLPLTLLKLNKAYEICVLEMGTNRFGEIKTLSEIACPSVGVITNIGYSHIESLETLQNVFREKNNLLKTLPHNAYSVLNKDDLFLSKAETHCNIIYFGIKGLCEYQATHISVKDRNISFKVKHVDFKVPLLGRHSIYNILAGIAVGQIFGIRLNDIAASLKKFKSPLNNRLTFHKMKAISIIDDSYNSNPLSFKVGIESLTQLERRGRRVIISSDMLELGRRSTYFHRKVGKLIANAGIDLLITVGPIAKFMGKSAIRWGMSKSKVLHFETRNALNNMLGDIIRQRDLVLVKGSRGTHMEEVVQRLKGKTALHLLTPKY